MRLYAIVLFIFLFNLFAATAIQIDMFSQQPIQPNSNLLVLFNESADDRLNQSLNKPPVDPGTAEDINFGDFLRGMGIFFTAFTYATVDVHSLMFQLIPSAPIAMMMAAVVYFIYAAAVTQLIFNRSFRVQR